MDKEEFIAMYGVAAYAQWLEEAATWYMVHPEGVTEDNKDWYDALLRYFKMHDKSWRKEHPSEVSDFRKDGETGNLDYFAAFYENWWREHIPKGPVRIRGER